MGPRRNLRFVLVCIVKTVSSVPVLNRRGCISSFHSGLFMEQYIINYHSSETEENQLNTPSLGNDMGLFIDNNTHLHLLLPA